MPYIDIARHSNPDNVLMTSLLILLRNHIMMLLYQLPFCFAFVISEYILDKTECPLQRERLWLDPDNCRFELRWRNERLVEVGRGLSI